MQGIRLIPRHAILGHTPYLSGSSGFVCLYRQILTEMLSHILIFKGFITSLLDVILIILRHIPYPLGSSGICLFVHTIIIERMSLVMTFLGFHHVLIDVILGHIPYLSRSFGGSRFVQTVHIEDMSHCNDNFGLHHVYVGCHTPLTSPLLSSSQTFRLRLLHVKRSNFAFIWIRCSNFICITFASSTVRRSELIFYISGFRFCFHMDQIFRLHLHHMC